MDPGEEQAKELVSTHEDGSFEDEILPVSSITPLDVLHGEDADVQQAHRQQDGSDFYPITDYASILLEEEGWGAEDQDVASVIQTQQVQEAEKGISQKENDSIQPGSAASNFTLDPPMPVAGNVASQSDVTPTQQQAQAESDIQHQDLATRSMPRATIGCVFCPATFASLGLCGDILQTLIQDH